MTIENVYKKLNDIYNDRYRDDEDIKNLLSEIENDIKLGTCYKVSKKSRVIDIIVKDNDFKCYIGSDKENRPLYIVNSNDEVGVVMPTAIY